MVGNVGDVPCSLDACLCKGQPYYVDTERALWPKQACQPQQVYVRVTATADRLSGDLG